MQNRVTCVMGKKGSGKSTLVGECIREMSRVIVIDSMAEYGPDCKCEVVEEADCVDAVVDAAERRRKFRLSLRCLSEDDNLELIRLAYEVPDSTIVIEETSLYQSPSSMPDEIKQLIRYGRHRGIDQVYVARRPTELHRDLTSNADVIVTFRQQEPRDLMYLRAYYGDDALTLPALPQYHIRVFGDLQRAYTPILERLAGQDSMRRHKDVDTVA